MTDFIPDSSFEKTLKAAFKVPEARPEFVQTLNQTLLQQAAQKKPAAHRPLILRPAFSITLLVAAILLVSFFLVGPQQVFAMFSNWLGYIPGVGIIQNGSSIRVLQKPISLTRQGITVSVNQAVLTPTETHLTYGVEGVSLSAYPKSESDPGCITQPYLLLPDGSHILIAEVSQPVPENVNQATFVMPCITGTQAGAAPEDWELPLTFVAAPKNFTVLPVVQFSPQPTATYQPTQAFSTLQPSEVSATGLAATLSPGVHASITVEKMIETADGYILLGDLTPNLYEGSWIQQTGALQLTDKEGKAIAYTFPTDISGTSANYTWSIEFKGAGVQFPITLSVPGVVFTQAADAAATLTVDVGSNPQPGDVIQVNQSVQIAGYTIRLVSITVNSDGYSFKINPGANLSGVNLTIQDHAAQGAGGGGGVTNGQIYTTSMIFDTLPVGKLDLILSSPFAAGPTETWQAQWQPETPQSFPTATTAAGNCFDMTAFKALPTLANELTGTVFLTQLNPQTRIISSLLDGTQIKELAEGSGRAALAQDGSKIVFSIDQGTIIQNLGDGTTQKLANVSGNDFHWSPDGSQIAMVNANNQYGIFILDVKSGSLRQLTDLGYESLAGWSPNGSRVYYAIPSTTSNGFKLRSVKVSNGESQDEFMLENSSLKAPYPAISPDGKWIAYRATNDTSLYLKSMDGSPARLLIDQSSDAITDIVWDSTSRFLGISLVTSVTVTDDVRSILLLQPDTCKAYWLSGLDGEINGLILH